MQLQNLQRLMFRYKIHLTFRYNVRGTLRYKIEKDLQCVKSTRTILL